MILAFCFRPSILLWQSHFRKAYMWALKFKNCHRARIYDCFDLFDIFCFFLVFWRKKLGFKNQSHQRGLHLTSDQDFRRFMMLTLNLLIIQKEIYFFLELTNTISWHQVVQDYILPQCLHHQCCLHQDKVRKNIFKIWTVRCNYYSTGCVSGRYVIRVYVGSPYVNHWLLEQIHHPLALFVLVISSI